ncbi:MAG: SH3 domain-containing protein [Oscillospiraceae bacterium]|nr:SH3 domain-containing protein [Oscillospiraceae bacterium]
MRKLVIALILLCGLMARAGIGLAGSDYGDIMAYVNGRNADKVHLREGPSASSASLGLYFTGAPVICDSPPNAEWVSVRIGSESGYMKGSFLYYNDPLDLPSKHLSARSKVLTLVLHSEPSNDAAILGGVFMNDRLKVLGETSDHWYYVEAEGAFFKEKVYGYARKVNVSLSGPVSIKAKKPFTNLPKFTFSSGAGAWSVMMTVYPDGTLSGYYHDSDMGDDGPGYPNGTRYERYFAGQFGKAVKLNDYEYSLNLDYITGSGSDGDEAIIDGVRVITSEIGIYIGDGFRLYLPGRSTADLPQGFKDWTGLSNEDLTGRMTFYGLYNVRGDYGFRSD